MNPEVLQQAKHEAFELGMLAGLVLGFVVFVLLDLALGVRLFRLGRKS